jgi:hypothetical protein
MTALLIHYLNKHVLDNLFPFAAPSKVELPYVAPLMDLFASSSDAPLTCSCCGWKGGQFKARKHYLVVEAIAELELFCPDCNQYLGFISEPAD